MEVYSPAKSEPVTPFLSRKYIDLTISAEIFPQNHAFPSLFIYLFGIVRRDDRRDGMIRSLVVFVLCRITTQPAVIHVRVFVRYYDDDYAVATGLLILRTATVDAKYQEEKP